jgi:hypothetical protein
VIHRTIVLTSWACCALIALSFGLFALHQVSGAAKHQVTSINVAPTESSPIGATTPYALTAPVAPVAVPPSSNEAQPRRFIDGAAKTLTSPFSSIVVSDNSWVTHGLPTLFALLAYGFGLGYVARFTRGMT